MASAQHARLGNDMARQYVTFSWLSCPTDARAVHWQHHMQHAAPAAHTAGAAAAAAAAAPHLPLLPRALERLRPRHGLSWQALLAAAAVGANIAALVYVARRAWASWGEEQERARAEEEQQDVTCAALAYLQRLWDVAMQVRAAAPCAHAPCVAARCSCTCSRGPHAPVLPTHARRTAHVGMRMHSVCAACARAPVFLFALWRHGQQSVLPHQVPPPPAPTRLPTNPRAACPASNPPRPAPAARRQT